MVPSTVAQLRLHALISSGEYSSLFMAQRDNEGEIVVVKRFSREGIQETPEGLRRVLREKWAMQTLSQLPHPFVVRYRFAHVDPMSVFLGMEHVGGGDLFSELQRRGPFAPAQARCYAAEIALALGHVHSFDIMYRDLKVQPPPLSPGPAAEARASVPSRALSSPFRSFFPLQP